MDDSDNSRFDDDVDEDGGTAPSVLDGPVAFGWASAAGEYAPADNALGGSGTSADGQEDDRSRRQESQSELQMPVAAAMVISEFLGDPFDVHYDARLNAGAEGFELSGGRLAGEPGAWEGMTLEGGAAALEQYGIDAHVEHGDVSSLERYLQEGRSIILAVDADELWYGQDDDSSVAEPTADQALVLSAIDGEAGIAILQDPASPTRDGFEVSLAALEDAWADSANGMVVTDTAVPDFSEARESGEATEATHSGERVTRADAQAERIRALGPAGAVILPILLGGRALIRRRTRA